MPINFPNSPSPSQLYTYDNKTWEWNGTYWEVYSALTSYITSAYTVGDGFSDISGVTGGNIALKSFSGVGITITDGGDKLTFTTSTNYLPLSGGTVTGATNFTGGLSANTISATTYLNLPYSGTVVGTGTTNYIPVWTGTTGLGNSIIQASSTNVAINTSIDPNTLLTIYTTGVTGVFSSANDYGVYGVGQTGSSFGVYGLNNSGGGGGAGVLGNMVNGTGVRGEVNGEFGPNIGVYGVASGINGGTPTNIGGYFLANGDGTKYSVALQDGTEGVGKVLVSQTAGGEANWSGELNITGVTATTISATTYDNLPGSSSSNCFTTFYVTNISGCSPVNILSPLNVTDGLNVTGTSTFTSQANFTGGLSASTFSAATYQNLPTDVFVNSGVYANGQITFTNTTGGTFSVTNIPIGGAGGQPYYLNLSVSQTPYQEFAASATTGTQQTTGVTIASGVTSTIANFLTPSGFPNISLIPAGYWSFYLHSYKADSSTTFDIFVEVYSRTTGGTETLLLSTDPTEVTSIGSASMEISDGYYSGSSLNLSDRILVKVKATNTGTASSTITFLTEGTVHYSYGVTPFTSAGAVTSVGLVVGTTGTDVNVSNSPITSSGNITLNIPDASATARGLVTSGTQTFAGVKTFSLAPNLSSLTASQILALDGSSNIQSLSTTTYPSLTELSYVKGVTSAIQTQLNNKFNTSGGTVSGNLTVTGTTTSDTISATTYQNLPVSAVTNGTGISTSTTNGVTTVTNTDLGSSQNIFKNIQIDGVSQFSAGSNSSNLNFSGVNITITSAATNTLVFSAGTGGAGAVSSVTAGSGLSGNSTTGTITLINTQVQGITGITASSGISASTSNNVVTLTNTGVTGITAGNNITIDQSTGNVTINSIGGVSFGNVYTTANNFNFL